MITNYSQTFIWEGFGLKLYIPQGCLPAGVEQCTININASLAGQYEFPQNSYLHSAVFWLRCEPKCAFTKALTLEISHCAKSENSSKLSFIRAVCSQEQLPYSFEHIGGDFNSHSSYGVINLDRFSGIGAIQEGSEDRKYCARLFYLGRDNISHEIHFVVTWNTETHLNVSHICMYM